MATCDLLLRGGHVIDPKNDVDGIADVAISDGTIQAVGPDLDIDAGRSDDVAGLHATPGLIDIHVPAYGG